MVFVFFYPLCFKSKITIEDFEKVHGIVSYNEMKTFISKIKNIEVIHSQKNIKSPNKNVKVKKNVKEKAIKTNKDSNNSKIQQTKNG